MVEEIRNFDGLALEELEAQTLDLLPDREEMLPINVNVGPVAPQTNVSNQAAVAVALFDSKSVAANYANNVNNFVGH